MIVNFNCSTSRQLSYDFFFSTSDCHANMRSVSSTNTMVELINIVDMHLFSIFTLDELRQTELRCLPFLLELQKVRVRNCMDVMTILVRIVLFKRQLNIIICVKNDCLRSSGSTFVWLFNERDSFILSGGCFIG